MPSENEAPREFPFLGSVKLKGTFKTRTGLHVRGGGAGINPRGVDAPLIRDPMSKSARQSDGLPYIPGSSLRGKLRTFLVRTLNKPVKEVVRAGGRPIRLHSCQDDQCEVCRLFGSVPAESSEEQWSLPAALHLSDLRLGNPDTFREELKSENALDRITAQSNPRQIERIPPETSFSVSFTYYVRRADHLEEDLCNLLTALALLQDDSLGGHGSRGYGAVSISLSKIKARRFGVQAQKELLIDYPQDLPLAEAVDRIGEALPEIKTFFASASQITFTKSAGPTAPKDIVRHVACLHFTSPLHVGEPRVGLEGCADVISADTLFSAIANTWLTIYGKQSLEQLLAEFNSAAELPDCAPPFLLSSAFPYRNTEFFFPKPLWQERSDEEEVDAKAAKALKALKDLKFLPAAFFQKWITGHLEKSDFGDWMIQEGETQKSLSATEILPRVRLDRLDLASNLYFCGQVYFPEDGGLYFLAEGTEENLAQLYEVLRLLGELGIGGERALGFGRFTLREQKIEEIKTLEFLASYPNRDAFLTLAPYFPTDREIRALVRNEGEEMTAYQLVERGGWVDSPELRSGRRKKTCRMFTEGSVFQTQPRGCLVDVTPEPVKKAPHHVYRYGFAFPVGMVK